MKDTLLSLVKVMIKDKYPKRQEMENERMFESIQSGRMDDWMWLKIIEKMYEEHDVIVINNQIREKIESRRG